MKMFATVFFLNFMVTGCENQKLISLNARESSSLLEAMLKNYDKKALPTVNSEPVDVTVQIYIEDMVPIETIHMHYSIDMYFRTYWTDPRLAYEKFRPLNSNLGSGRLGPMALDAEIYNHIWKPDIYFPVGKKGVVHQITKPNKMLRLESNGYIFSSQRVSVTAFCSMDLHDFPFDEQHCKFNMLSYGYSTREIRINWNNASGGPIFPPEDKNMLEYTLAGYSHEKSIIDLNVAGHIDTLLVHFHFTRNRRYYLLQMYLPCILIVILSWVGFWIDYRSTPARVTLGITTVLTMAALGNSIRAASPPASYTKALDIYLLVTFCYVFLALIEYAIVGITDIKWKKKITMASSKTKRHNNSFHQDKMSTVCDNPLIIVSTVPAQYISSSSFIDNEECKTPGTDLLKLEINLQQQGELEKVYTETLKKRNRGKLKKTTTRIKSKLFNKQLEDLESHVIDRFCRYIFPVSFIIGNICYFMYYLAK